MTTDLPGDEERFDQLLLDYNEHPERRDEIEAEVRRRFERRLAVLVLDSSGFSRTVRATGIVHFLAMLERLERMMRPIVQEHEGHIVAKEGDTIFAVFPDAVGALEAARRIADGLRRANEALPERDEIYGSIGIGYGEILLIGSHHIAGDEVNLAFKLGEDLAQHGEILLSEGAWKAVCETSDEPNFEPCNYSISGLDISAYRLVPA